MSDLQLLPQSEIRAWVSGDTFIVAAHVRPGCNTLHKAGYRLTPLDPSDDLTSIYQLEGVELVVQGGDVPAIIKPKVK